MKHEFPAPRPVEAYVELRSGDLRVSAAQTETVTVELTGARAQSVVVEAHGPRISIVEPNRSGFFSTQGDLSVTLVVPEQSGLTCKLGSAAVRATGELGAVRITTGAGDVALGTVTGPAAVRTGAGDIGVEALRGESDLKAGAGTISVGRVTAPIQLKTGAGSIDVAEAAAPVTLKSGSGDLSVGSASRDTTLSTASGDIRVARLTGGQSTLKNVTGSVRVGIPDGTPVWTDISTGTGRIESTLTPTGAPAEGQEHVELRARSVSGNVYLERLQGGTS